MLGPKKGVATKRAIEPEGTTKRLTITVPEPIDTEIRQLAESLGKGISEVWSDAAESFLGRLKGRLDDSAPSDRPKRLLPVTRA